MTLLFKIHEEESPNYRVYADDHKELFVIGVEFINDFENDEKVWAWVKKYPEKKGIFTYNLITYLSEMPDDYAHGPTSHNYIDAILAAYPDNIKHIFKTMKCNVVLKNLENMNSDYGKKHFFEDKRSLAFDKIMTEANKNKKPTDDFDDIPLDINEENIDNELDIELDNYNN